MIEVNCVFKKYVSQRGGSVEALKGVSMSLPDTGMISIIGKSGCGKTTLLNMIGALDSPDSGEIVVSIQSQAGEKRLNLVKCSENELDEFRNLYLGCVFQDYYLIDEWTVRQNLELVLKQQREAEGISENDKRIKEALDFVDLSGCEGRYVNELSGGQQQRVSVARAMIKNPRILIADEPTGNLDSATTKAILDLLKKASERCLVVMVTHDEEAAAVYSDRIIKIVDGQVSYDRELNQPQGDSLCCDEGKEAVRLPFGTVVSIAWASLRVRKWKLVVSTLVFMILFTAIELMGVYQASDAGKSIASLAEHSGDPFLYTQIEKVFEGGTGNLLSVSTGNSTAQKDLLRKEFGADMCFPMIEGLEVECPSKLSMVSANVIIGGLADNRFELRGRMPENANEIVITDCIEYELGFIENESINETVFIGGKELIVCGVIVIGYNDFYASVSTISNAEQVRRIYEMETCGRRVLVSRDFPNTLADDISLQITKGDLRRNGELTADLYRTTVGNIAALETGNYTLVDGHLPRNDNEIIVSSTVARTVLAEREWFSEEAEYLFQDIHGENTEGMFSGYVSIYEYIPHARVVGTFELKDGSGIDLFVTEEIYHKLKTDYLDDKYFDSLEVVVSDKNRSAKAFTEVLRHGITMHTFGVKDVYLFYESKATTDSVYKSELPIAALLMLLLGILFFTFNAKDNHAQIGIMRALGVTRSDITMSMIMEGCVLTISSIVVAMGALFGWYILFNRRLMGSFGFSFQMMNINPIMVLFPIVVFLAGTVFAVSCPIFIMTGRKPVDIIKRF